MRRFLQLFESLDGSTKTTAKVAALRSYFQDVEPAEGAWAVHLLTGKRPKRPISTTEMRELASDLAGIPAWLVEECYDAVGDLSETLARLIPDQEETESKELLPLGSGLDAWIEKRLLPLAALEPEQKRIHLRETWLALNTDERFLFNKLMSGTFRVGVSQELVIRALSESFGVPKHVLSHRLMGQHPATAEWFENLTMQHTESLSDVLTLGGQPFPFCLAHPVEETALEAELGPIQDWCFEWKFDGIRGQLIRREGTTYLWTRGEELVTDRYPEVASWAESLPDGTVLDGEILAWNEAENEPLPFNELQKRIGRKIVGKKLLSEVPVRFRAFDVLETGAQDVRSKPLTDRKTLLHDLIDVAHRSEVFSPGTWEEARQLRESAEQHNVEGLMLKRWSSSYGVGRKRGDWWKWKIDPMTIDAVLVYAQRGSGKRASLYTDYTFAIWKDGALVPFAKAYSGLTDKEIAEVDAYVKRNTLERFGPVRTVKAELVFELAFEGVSLSTRHKSGLAVRFPRITRWRRDLRSDQANRFEDLQKFLGLQSNEAS